MDQPSSGIDCPTETPRDPSSTSWMLGPQVREKAVKTFQSPELANALFALYLGDKVRPVRGQGSGV